MTVAVHSHPTGDQFRLLMRVGNWETSAKSKLGTCTWELGETVYRRLRYWSSVTCSSHSTTFPSSASWIAMCVIAVLGAAPCQCFSPGANHTTSPGQISSIG